MPKTVTAEYECDAANCGVTSDNEAEFLNVEIRMHSDSEPGVERASGVLCTNHADILEKTLVDNFGLRLQ